MHRKITNDELCKNDVINTFHYGKSMVKLSSRSCCTYKKFYEVQSNL